MLYKFIFDNRTKLAHSKLSGHDALPDQVAHEFMRVGIAKTHQGKISGRTSKAMYSWRLFAEGRAFCPDGTRLCVAAD
jgi:hypothetical protein